MKLRYKILIALALILAIFFTYDFITKPPLKAASNTSLEGFVCSNETKTLTDKEKETREQREAELRKALSNTMGIRMNGHGIQSPEIGPKRDRVYMIQTKLSIEDWDILSEVFIKDYKKWRASRDKMADAIDVLFAIRGKEAITILECKLNNTIFTQLEKQYYEGEIHDIVGLSKSPGFILSYEKYKKD
jgi:hypothetical protein